MKKFITKFVCVLVCFSIALSLVACETPHKHSYQEEWTKTEQSHYHTCSCGDKIDEAKHNFDAGSITKEASLTEKGEKTFTCLTCNYTKTEEIPMLEPEPNPDPEPNPNPDPEPNPGYNSQETLGGKTAEEIYNDIISVIDNYSNYTTSIKYDIKVDLASIEAPSYKLPIEMNLKMYDVFKINGEEFEETTEIDYGKMDMTAMGGPIMDLGGKTTLVHLVDGIAYFYSNEVFNGTPSIIKGKYAATLDSLALELGISKEEIFNPIYDFSNQAFSDVLFNINTQDGADIYFELIISGNEAEEYQNKFISRMNLDATGTMSDISYRFNLNADGTLENVEVGFVYKVINNEVGFIYDYFYEGVIEFSNINSTTINPPADANTYPTIK